MRLRRYTFAEFLDADCEELARMYADNQRAIQLLDFGCVLCGSWAVLLALDIFGV